MNAFPFESLLGVYKARIHSGNKPLQQVAYYADQLNRKSENQLSVDEKITTKPLVNFLCRHGYNVKHHYNAYYIPQSNCLVKRNSLADSTIRFHGVHFKVKDIFLAEGSDTSVIFAVLAYKNSSEFFAAPVSSMLVGIYKISVLAKEGKIRFLKVDNTMVKCFLLPRKNYHVAIDLIHSI